MEKINQNRLQLAERILVDALRKENSAPTRATCAFDAGYVYLLTALHEPTGGTHPSIETLKSGVSRLGVSLEKMAPAIEFLKRQYSTGGTTDLLPGLLEWARDMKVFAVKTTQVGLMVQTLANNVSKAGQEPSKGQP